jgi:hypothetical protein
MKPFAKLKDKHGVVHVRAGSYKDGFGSYSWCIYNMEEMSTDHVDEPITCFRCTRRVDE